MKLIIFQHWDGRSLLRAISHLLVLEDGDSTPRPSYLTIACIDLCSKAGETLTPTCMSLSLGHGLGPGPVVPGLITLHAS